MTDGLKDAHREAIIATIAANDRVERAVLFGSRATGTNTATSDVDIALYGDHLTLTDQARLAAALDEIPMAQSVDLLLYDSIANRTLREHIHWRGVEWYARPNHQGTGCDTSSAANTWPIRSLQQAGVSLIDCEHRTPPASEDGYPYVGIPQIKDGRIDLDGARCISHEHFREWTRRTSPQPFDIVLSRRCNPGDTGFVSPGFVKFALGQNLVLLRSNREEILKPFLRWLVRGPQWWTQVGKYINVGAVFDSLKCVDIPEFQLPIPPLPEQRAIAHILGTLDDKIELNRRMNATLEAMARALFRSWFVDFDPVRAKMEGHDTGLPKEIADLFPDQLVESELGEVPEGWPLVPLPEVIEVNPSRPLQKGMTAPYLDMANMPTRGHAPNSLIQRPFGSGMRFTNGDTLVARITPCLENGKTAYVDFLRDDEIGWGSTEYIVMKPRTPLPNEFAYCLARGTRFRDFAIRNMSGTSGRQRVPATALHGFSMPFPPERVAAAFGLAAHTLFARAADALQESRSLSALRDTLLPRLVSGELRLDVHGRHTGNVSPSLPKKRVP